MACSSMWPSTRPPASALWTNSFRGAIPRLRAPLPTSRLPPHGDLRTARSRGGSLDLHRRGLPPPAPCQSPGKSGRNVTLRGKIAHPLVIARPPAPALPPSAGARRSGLRQYSGNPTCFHKKTCEILGQAVSDHLHLRPYFVAKSQTKMGSPLRTFARIPPVGWQGVTAKTADKDDKAQSGAPHYATAAPLSRTTIRGQNRHTTRAFPLWKPTRALLLRPIQPQMPPQGVASVGGAEQPAALQHRHHLLHKVLNAIR